MGLIVKIADGAKCCAVLRRVAPRFATERGCLRSCSEVSITTHHLTIPVGAARLAASWAAFIIFDNGGRASRAIRPQKNFARCGFRFDALRMRERAAPRASFRG